MLFRSNRAYFYSLEDPASLVVGAVAVARARFLVAEALPSGVIRLFRVDLGAATNISSGHWLDDPGSTAYELGHAALRPVKKLPLFDLQGEGELDGLALVDYHTVAALRTTVSGTELWLQRLEGAAITEVSAVENPTVITEMTKAWVRPPTETL